MELPHLCLWAQSALKEQGPRNGQIQLARNVGIFPEQEHSLERLSERKSSDSRKVFSSYSLPFDCRVNKSYHGRLVEKRQVNNRNQFSKYIGSQTMDDNRRNESNVFQMWHDDNLTLER